MDSIKNLTIFAGVNGAGKSTLFYSENAGDLGIRLNSDEIIRANGLDWKRPTLCWESSPASANGLF